MTEKEDFLNLINEWWMNNTRHIIDNHLLHVDGSYLISKKCNLIPLEIIVRGYITGGNTQTSLWTHYNKHFNVDKKTDTFSYCGIEFPSNLVKNQKLPTPVITPTTKGERDELISYQQILDEGIINQEGLDFMYQEGKRTFAYGSYVVDQNGLILVDTKYEFGVDTSGNIILIDEVHTYLDSSRYWIKETYSLDTEPQKLDKDAARDYVRNYVTHILLNKFPKFQQTKKKGFSIVIRDYMRD